MHGASDDSGYESAGDAEKNCNDEAARIFSRHEKLRKCPDDETDNNCPEYNHNKQGEASGGCPLSVSYHRSEITALSEAACFPVDPSHQQNNNYLSATQLNRRVAREQIADLADLWLTSRATFGLRKSG